MTDEAQSGPSDLQLQQAVRLGIAATERGEYAQAMKVFKVLYEDPRIKGPVEGLSYYGLCVAIEDKQAKKGVDLCRAAIEAQFYDAKHYCNLIRLHIKKSNRRAAVEVLEEALGKLPEDSSLLKLQKELGIETSRPPIGFLGRGNPINRMLTNRQKTRKARSKFSVSNIHPLVTATLALLLFVAIFGTTYYVLYKQAYGEAPPLPWKALSAAHAGH